MVTQNISMASNRDHYVRALEDATLEAWLQAVASSTKRPREVVEMEKTISWRVTKPLRSVRQLAARVKRNANGAGIRLAADKAVKFFRNNDQA